MNKHRVLVLGVVAAAALVAALWSSQTRRPAQAPIASQPVVPGLAAAMNDITALRIRTAGDALQATINKTESGWVVAERDWPADANLLREYLLKLANARRVEAKTDKPALYYKLGVEDIATKDTPGVQLELDGLKPPVKLIIGRNVARGTGHYVRHAGDAQSWQTDADLALEKNAANWLQRDLLDLAAGRVLRARVVPPSGAPIEIVRAVPGGGGDFALAGVPRGREPASEFVADATAGLLSGLRFDDVAKRGAAAPPAAGLTRAEFVAGDGVTVKIEAWAEQDKTWARFSATLDEEAAAKWVEQEQAKAVREHAAAVAAAAQPAAEPEAAKAGETAGSKPAAPAVPAASPAAPLAVSDPAKDREQRLAALRTEVETMNARFAERSFVLPPFKATQLVKSLEDYLKPKA
jgi:hypothetical protein